MSVAQDFDYADVGTYYYYPATRTDAAGDLFAAFSGSSSSSFASAYAGSQSAGNINVLTNLSVTRAGDAAYTISPTRWGDYSGAGVDPARRKRLAGGRVRNWHSNPRSFLGNRDNGSKALAVTQASFSNDQAAYVFASYGDRSAPTWSSCRLEIGPTHLDQSYSESWPRVASYGRFVRWLANKPSKTDVRLAREDFRMSKTLQGFRLRAAAHGIGMAYGAGTSTNRGPGSVPSQ